jgi:hypothetical protein
MDINNWKEEVIKDIFVFSDEAGTEKDDFLSYGLLCIEKDKFNEIINKLIAIKEKHKCLNDIHYRNLPNDFNSTRLKTAIDWLKAVITEAIKEFTFQYSEIHLTHKHFSKDKFSQDHHLYNYFYNSAIRCLIHRQYKNCKANITWILHQKEESKKVVNDPFCKIDYLKQVISNMKIIPKEIVVKEYRPDVEKDKKIETAIEFVDLLLSSTRNAIHENSTKSRGKVTVSQMASEIFKRNEDKFYTERNITYSRFPNELKQFQDIKKLKVAPKYYDSPHTNKSLNSFF